MLIACKSQRDLQAPAEPGFSFLYVVASARTCYGCLYLFVLYPLLTRTYYRSGMLLISLLLILYLRVHTTVQFSNTSIILNGCVRPRILSVPAHTGFTHWEDRREWDLSALLEHRHDRGKMPSHGGCMYEVT